MNTLPWAVEIDAGDAKYDLTALTVRDIKEARVGIIVIGSIAFGITVLIYAHYIKTKYRCYIKAKKKQERKAKRELKLKMKEETNTT